MYKTPHTRQLLLVLLLFLGCEVHAPEGKKKEETPPPEPPKTPKVFVPTAPPEPPKKDLSTEANASPYLGKRDARVTLVAFSDLQCPYCKKADLGPIKELKATYGDNLRVVWKDMPLASIHPSAQPAAIASRAILAQGVDKFFALHDLIFQNQVDMKGAAWTPEMFEKYVSMIPGADVSKWRSALLDPTLKTSIEADMALGKSLGVTGTPCFFINGEKLSGAQQTEKFAEVIDRQIKRADELLGKGTDPADLYAALIKDGATGLPAGVSSSKIPAGMIFKVPVETVSTP